MSALKVAGPSRYADQVNEVIAAAINKALDEHPRLAVQMRDLAVNTARNGPDSPHAEAIFDEWGRLAADVAAVAPGFRELVPYEGSRAILLITYADRLVFGEARDPAGVPIAIASPAPSINDLRVLAGLPKLPGPPTDPELSKDAFERKVRALLRAKDSDGRWIVPTVSGLIRLEELADVWCLGSDALERQMRKLGVDWIALRDEMLRERGFRD